MDAVESEWKRQERRLRPQGIDGENVPLRRARDVLQKFADGRLLLSTLDDHVQVIGSQLIGAEPQAASLGKASGFNIKWSDRDQPFAAMDFQQEECAVALEHFPPGINPLPPQEESIGGGAGPQVGPFFLGRPKTLFVAPLDRQDRAPARSRS